MMYEAMWFFGGFLAARVFMSVVKLILRRYGWEMVWIKTVYWGNDSEADERLKRFKVMMTDVPKFKPPTEND